MKSFRETEKRRKKILLKEDIKLLSLTIKKTMRNKIRSLLIIIIFILCVLERNIKKRMIKLKK